jgi:hypothetical protein
VTCTFSDLNKPPLSWSSMVAPARSDEEEAMSTAEPLSEDQWPATGVDLETRRRRILAT